MNKYNLKSISDEEWLNEVPSELLPLYCGGSWIGSTEKENHRFEKREFTIEEINKLKIKYPKYFLSNE